MTNASVVMDSTKHYVIGIITILATLCVALMFVIINMSITIESRDTTIALKREEVKQLNLHINAVKAQLDEERLMRQSLEERINEEVIQRLHNEEYHQKLLIQKELYKKILNSVETPSIVLGKVK